MNIDTLREEMINRGCNNSQLNSKVLPIILDIINNTDNDNVGLWEKEEIYSKKLNNLEQSCRFAEERYNKIKQLQKEITDEWKTIKEYIEKFNQELLNCETQEGKDAIKRAQLYVNSVRVNTKYDNTAFIIGLAAILSNGKIETIQRLKEINPNFINKYKCDIDGVIEL